MALIGELVVSRPRTDGETRSQELVYIVTDTDDDTIVLDTVNLVSPATFNGLYKNEITCEPENYQVWRATVRYSSRKKKEPGFEERSIEISTTQVKRLQTLQRFGSWAPNGEQAPDTKGAIGVDGDTIHGVDVDVPAMTMTIKKVFAAEDVTNAVIKAWGRMAGRTNDAPWLGWDTGEVKFLGSDGGSKDAETVEFNFKFALSENADNIQIDNIAGPIAKKGWEYLWVMYDDDVDENKRVKLPRAVYVDRVLEEGDFTIFGIRGT